MELFMSSKILISECIQRWGNPASIALMDPDCLVFSQDSLEGIIGYKIQAHHAIVFGDPLCPPEHVDALTQAFHNQFKDSVKNIIYLATTKKFTHEALEHECEAALSIGQEMIIDPTQDPRAQSGDKASTLRRNCKKAVQHEITVHEYTDQDPALEKMMNSLGESWSQHRQGPQVYLQQVSIFSHRECKRFFYAKQNNKIIGVLILTRLDAYQGWVISFAMIDPQASYSTSDYLIVNALETLGKEGCHFLAIGTVPSQSINDIIGLGTLNTWCVRQAYAASLKLFHLTERERYWKKFCPTHESTYLMLAKPQLGLVGAYGIFSALNAL
jgi:lysylphosphatidylglycerol synthetase-like protein (DUF2156 family)